MASNAGTLEITVRSEDLVFIHKILADLSERIRVLEQAMNADADDAEDAS